MNVFEKIIAFLLFVILILMVYGFGKQQKEYNTKVVSFINWYQESFKAE